MFVQARKPQPPQGAANPENAGVKAAVGSVKAARTSVKTSSKKRSDSKKGLEAAIKTGDVEKIETAHAAARSAETELSESIKALRHSQLDMKNAAFKANFEEAEKNLITQGKQNATQEEILAEAKKVSAKHAQTLAEAQGAHSRLASVAAASHRPPPTVVKFQPAEVRVAQDARVLPPYDEFLRKERAALQVALIKENLVKTPDEIQQLAVASTDAAVARGEVQAKNAQKAAVASPFQHPPHAQGSHQPPRQFQSRGNPSVVFSELRLCPGIANGQGCKYVPGQGNPETYQRHHENFHHSQE